VPAAILLSEFTHDWRALAFGVSVGGFGFAIGSLANLIAVRAQDKDKPWVKKLVAAYESDDVRKFIDQKFSGAIVPAF
jgi:hypothetical protein